jgi:hypothetical protein
MPDNSRGWAVRTTEMISVDVCEEQAFHHRTIVEELTLGVISEYPSKSTFYSIRGTVAHHYIANETRKMIELPEEPLRFYSESDKRLYRTIMSTPRLRSKLKLEVELALTAWRAWWKLVKPIPLAVEQDIYYGIDGRPRKGSIDLVALIKQDTLDWLIPQNMRNVDEYRLILIDYKTGKSADASHRKQLSAYFYGANQSILQSLLKKHEYYTDVDDNVYGLDVYLGNDGEHASKMVVLNTQEIINISARFENAKQIPVDSSGKPINGVRNSVCYFCAFTDRCSLIHTSVEQIDQKEPPDEEELFFDGNDNDGEEQDSEDHTNYSFNF